MELSPNKVLSLSREELDAWVKTRVYLDISKWELDVLIEALHGYISDWDECGGKKLKMVQTMGRLLKRLEKQKQSTPS